MYFLVQSKKEDNYNIKKIPSSYVKIWCHKQNSVCKENTFKLYITINFKLLYFTSILKVYCNKCICEFKNIHINKHIYTHKHTPNMVGVLHCVNFYFAVLNFFCKPTKLKNCTNTKF